MITPLGMLLRRLRDENNERLYDMAEKLKKPSSFLSAVEFGKKAPPQDLVDTVIRLYGLKANETTELRNAAQLSSRSVKVDLGGVSNQSRELAVAFARQFTSLEPERVERLLSVLREDTDNVRGGSRSTGAK